MSLVNILWNNEYISPKNEFLVAEFMAQIIPAYKEGIIEADEVYWHALVGHPSFIRTFIWNVEKRISDFYFM